MIPTIILPQHEKAFVLTHMGLGDLIMCNGLIRYICSLYKYVQVSVKQKDSLTFRDMFADVPHLSMYPVVEDIDISPNWGCPMHTFATITKGYDVYMTGCHILPPARCQDFRLFPLCFYDDVDIPRHFFWTKSFVPKTKEALELYASISDIPYIFMHNTTSKGALFAPEQALEWFQIDKHQTLVVNPHVNMYEPGHRWFALANQFLEPRSLLAYTYILENSNMNLLSDSCIFCLCHLLQIHHTNNYVVTRSFQFDPLYTRTTYSTQEEFTIRTRFQPIALS
jgi:hypothetical protein